jgi:thiol-disulfide isomerase/thioredoxin
MPLRTGTPLPELTGATEWLGPEVRIADLIGKPTLVHFWAMSCPICHDNMPTVQRWRCEFGRENLNVVAIHMPREELDTDVSAVRMDAASMGIQEPCAIDNRHCIGERFQVQFWPAYFLFDAQGNLVARAAGHAGLSLIDTPLRRLAGAGAE